MSREKEIIKHKGKVVKVDEAAIYVEIIALSACASCHARSACTLADMQEKIIEIKKRPGDAKYHTGDSVSVVLEQSLGYKALLLGYLIPFIILVASLFILIELTANEGLSALISIALMIPYYLSLYLRRDKLKKTFDFRLTN